MYNDGVNDGINDDIIGFNPFDSDDSNSSSNIGFIPPDIANVTTTMIKLSKEDKEPKSYKSEK
jgi:hypothetical protein